MKKKLTFDDTERLLAQLRVSRPRDDCWSCDCLQGFLSQIELDAGEDIAGLVNRFKVVPSQTHRCFGCKPAPPAEIFSSHIHSPEKAEQGN